MNGCFTRIRPEGVSTRDLRYQQSRCGARFSWLTCVCRQVVDSHDLLHTPLRLYGCSQWFLHASLSTLVSNSNIRRVNFHHCVGIGAWIDDFGFTDWLILIARWFLNEGRRIQGGRGQCRGWHRGWRRGRHRRKDSWLTRGSLVTPPAYGDGPTNPTQHR